MAYPQVQSITPTTIASASTTHNVNMPATVNTNDLLLALFASVAGSITVTTPSGWTQITTQSNTFIRLSVYGKIASGSEDGTTVNFLTSIATRAVAQVYRITGDYHDLTTVGIETGAASGTSLNPNSPNLNPVNWDVEETLWITAGTCSNNVSAVSSYPSNYTSGTYTQSGSAGSADAQLASARRENSVSAENPGAFTFDNVANWIAITIAIRPSFISQTVQPDVLTNTPTFFDVGLSQSGTLIPALFDATPTLYSPTLVYEQALLPDVFTVTQIFFDAAMATALSPPLLDNTPTFYGAEIINTQILEAPLLSNTPTFYGPEFRGPRNLESPLITNTSVFYGPQVFGTWRDVDLPYGGGEW